MISCEDNSEDEFFLDPELERIREEGLLSERVNYDKLAKELCEQVDDIHSAYLFHHIGSDARKKICICISSTPASPYYNSWKDLAGELGLTIGQIGCIEKYNKDFTDMVLMTFSQKSDGALSTLVNAFLKIDRLDALSIASETFPVIAEYARKDYCKRNENSDSLHTSEQEGGKKILLRPRGMRQIKHMLPVTLQEEMNQIDEMPQNKILTHLQLDKDFAGNFIRRIENMQLRNAAPIDNNPQIVAPRYGKRVMLTFASDCYDIAKKVAQEFKRKRPGLLPMRVVILDEHEEKVHLSPFEFIAHQFAKADYIVPILSERYFDSVCNGREVSLIDYLDESYIKVIFNLMSLYYTENNCMNDKIRCIIPNRFKNDVFVNSHFGIYSFLKVYTFDGPNDVEKLVVRLAKAKCRHKRGVDF